MIKSKFASFKLNPNNTIMEKTPRYTQRERNMVLSYAAQYKDIIENKRTDAESNRKKDEVWTTIAKEFNSRVYHQRTAKQLRQLYKNMKLLLKKDLTTDGRSESFMDILTALQSQNGNVPSLAHHYSDGRSNGKIKQSNNNEKMNSSQIYNNNNNNNNVPNIEGDVVIIKSEDLSDNDQSFKNEMDDDSLSNKDIPEVCLEEDDDDAIFDPSCINPVASYLNLQPNSNHHSNHHSQQQQSQQGLTPQIQLQQLIQHHQQQQQQRHEVAQNNQQKRFRENRTPSSRREPSNSPSPLNFNNQNDDRHHHRHSNNNSSYTQNNMNGERLQTIQLTANRSRDNHNKSPPLHNLHSQSNSPTSINGDDGGGIRSGTGTESLFALAIEERKRKIELLNAQIEYWKTLTKKIKMSSSNDTDLSVGLCNGTCPCSHSNNSPTSPANINNKNINDNNNSNITNNNNNNNCTKESNNVSDAKVNQNINQS